MTTQHALTLPDHGLAITGNCTSYGRGRRSRAGPRWRAGSWCRCRPGRGCRSRSCCRGRRSSRRWGKRSTSGGSRSGCSVVGVDVGVNVAVGVGVNVAVAVGVGVKVAVAVASRSRGRCEGSGGRSCRSCCCSCGRCGRGAGRRRRTRRTHPGRRLDCNRHRRPCLEEPNRRIAHSAAVDRHQTGNYTTCPSESRWRSGSAQTFRCSRLWNWPPE